MRLNSPFIRFLIHVTCVNSKQCSYNLKFLLVDPSSHLLKVARREERRLLHLHFLFEAAPTVPANIGFLTSESLALSGVGDVPEGPLSLSLSLEALSHFLAHFSLLGLESC